MEWRFIFVIKIALYTMCLIVVMTLLNNIKTLHTTWQLLPIKIYEENVHEYKYILLWTNPRTVPLTYLLEGQSVFVSRKCPYTNCMVSANKSLLSDIRLFDVIIFHGPELSKMVYYELPKLRSSQQKYVFASIESSDNYPLCSDRFNGYFNWTWTYRLDSEIRWGYIMIKDSKDNVIGPNKDMNWLEWNAMEQVSDKIREQLKSKTKAVAWFVSNCQTKSRRESFALALERYLLKYNLKLDIFGACGKQDCTNENQNECDNMIEKDYYFYLSFENAFSEDYVTEKLLIPLQNNVIPIVYGGANYTRFLPHGSYLNARELGVRKLGDKIYELIRNPLQYAEYFKWKNYYLYHKTSDSLETDEYCKMCAQLNNDKMMTQTSIYKDLRKWWDPPNASC